MQVQASEKHSTKTTKTKPKYSFDKDNHKSKTQQISIVRFIINVEKIIKLFISKPE